MRAPHPSRWSQVRYRGPVPASLLALVLAAGTSPVVCASAAAPLALEALPVTGGERSVQDVATADEYLWGAPPELHGATGRRAYWCRARLGTQLAVATDYVLLPERLWREVELYVPRPRGGFAVARTGQA